MRPPASTNSRAWYIPGNRLFAASSTMCWCSPNNIGLDESVRALFHHRREGICDLVGTVGRHELQLHSQRSCRVLDTLHDVRHRLFAVRMGMPECSHANESGNDISEQLQALGDEFRAEKGRPG